MYGGNHLKFITMKSKLMYSAAFLLVITVFSSCSKLESIADFTFHPSYTANIDVAIPAATQINVLQDVYSFNDSITINPLTDTLVAKYESNIKSWTVDSITGIFTDVSAAVTITDVSLTIKTNTESFGWQASSISLSNGTELVLNNDQGQLDKLGQVLNGTEAFKVILSGTSNMDDVHFTLSVKLNTTLVANPLGSI